ncbi:MAG: ABC transporter substrate-binding protein [Desulfuromonadales bacterium]|nr:MAG: ABC transporter substrate-binding protein [Desulfuromonadales bacterium]
MTRILVILTMLLVLFAGSGEAAQKVLALQSLRVAPYDEVLRGVRSVVNGTFKKLVISDMEGLDIAKAVRQERPDVILAIGADALTKVKKIKDIPVVYLMVLDPQNTLTVGNNITGIGMNIPPERQAAALQGALPRLKKIGIPYNPSQTGALAKRTQAVAKGLGIETIAREVRTPRDVLTAVEGMKGDIDALWMLPDITVAAPETIEYLLLFSLNNRIPILTFSDKYVEMGAFMALDIDPYDLGRQGGDMVKRILGGASPGAVPRTEPRSAIVTVNSKIARKLGINLNEEALGRAKVIK